MNFLAKALGLGRFAAGLGAYLVLSAASVQAWDVTYDRWKGEPPRAEAGARILAVYRIEGKEVPVWSRMPGRPYQVLGVLRSIETVGFTHQPFHRVAQEAFRRGGNAIAVLAPRHLPDSWIRGDDAGVTNHVERFTVLVLRSSSGEFSPRLRQGVLGRIRPPAVFLDDPA